jgi:hypothetical protein
LVGHRRYLPLLLNTWRAQGRTEWHRVVIANEKIAEVAERYLKKGARGIVPLLRRCCAAAANCTLKA